MPGVSIVSPSPTPHSSQCQKCLSCTHPIIPHVAKLLRRTIFAFFTDESSTTQSVPHKHLVYIHIWIHACVHVHGEWCVMAFRSNSWRIQLSSAILARQAKKRSYQIHKEHLQGTCCHPWSLPLIQRGASQTSLYAIPVHHGLSAGPLFLLFQSLQIRQKVKDTLPDPQKLVHKILGKVNPQKLCFLKILRCQSTAK